MRREGQGRTQKSIVTLKTTMNNNNKTWSIIFKLLYSGFNYELFQHKLLPWYSCSLNSFSPVREADRGFWGTVGRPARLGFTGWRGGFGLAAVLEELRALAPVSVFGSVFIGFSDEAVMESPLLRTNRLSGDDW